jgi:hypothetical protein
MISKWTDKTSAMPEKTTVYTVRHIEPLNQFDAKFFQRTLKRHFSFAKAYFPAISWGPLRALLPI